MCVCVCICVLLVTVIVQDSVLPLVEAVTLKESTFLLFYLQSLKQK